MGIAAVGVGMAALGAAQQYQSSRTNEKIQSNALAFNNDIALRNARLSRERAQEQAEKTRQDTKFLVSRQEATSAASGVVTTTGSPLLARMQQAKEGELEAYNILKEGAIDAQGFEAQASFRDFETNVARLRGSQERTGILLSGLSSVGSSLYTLKK